MGSLIPTSGLPEFLQRRLALFPAGASLVDEPPRLGIAGHPLDELAQKFGTPLYVYDETSLEQAVAGYRAALRQHYPGPSGITYAGKAYLCLALAQWMQRQGLWLDCTGAGELYIAAAASVPRYQVLVHGVNKSPEDLDAALAQAGTLVVDNLTELKRLNTAYKVHRAVRIDQPLPEIWLRLRPGLAVETLHKHTQTGQNESKFGLSVAETHQAVRFCLENNLPLTGIHFHQGSHFHDPAPIGPALETVLDLLSALQAETGWQAGYLSPGGGWGVAYHEDDLPQPDVNAYIAFIAQRLAQGCAQRGLQLPHLQLEPGRSIVARAGVAVYRLGAVKHASGRRWLLLDGGLADNPRPALYGARYTALPVAEPQRILTGPAWLGGPYCESGDILIENLPMPEMQPGEWIAVPVSGAYHLSMGSNYNGALKPAVVWVNHHGAYMIQRRETLDDLLRRDSALPDEAPE